MNREGVVQRRTARPQNNGGLADVQQTPQQDYDRRSGSDEDLEDMDSKETRLTLMEEVLLLGLKDKEVCNNTRFDTWKPLFNCLLLFTGLHIILE